MTERTALVMAGGTGGHIFPGLAVAEALRERGWRVHWLGAPGSMEAQLVPPRGFRFETGQFGGVRGKGPLKTLVLLPLRLLRAFWQSIGVVRRVQPDVVVGLGGYITFPGGMMSVLLGKPLVLHEQNSVAGMANKVLAGVADRVFTRLSQCAEEGAVGGQPAARSVPAQPDPAARFAGRSGPLRLLVVGGSLGAKALNDVVPQALARIARHAPAGAAPERRQADRRAARQLRGSRRRRPSSRPSSTTPRRPMPTPTSSSARAGASTVTEIAAVGAAALFVPFPSAVDDHQTTNARFLVDAGGGWLVQQTDLTPELLADLLQKTARTALIERAAQGQDHAEDRRGRSGRRACEELAKMKHAIQAHSLRGHRRLRHDRHRRSAAQPGLPHLRLRPGRQRHAAPPARAGHPDLRRPRRGATSTAPTPS
jgi:UDP-N-acetylglucosamine--N-acetylmuramyl-(pentapeptide) pyrophosphoryl-undecaprenol N-acetylglucosamine transferase